MVQRAGALLVAVLLTLNACSREQDSPPADSAIPVVPFVSEDSLRQVEYQRHEFHGEPEARKASLLAFVYDVPYLGCWVLPPRHLLNQYLRSGGSDGGMSPGATWKPFELTAREYAQLVAAIRAVPPESLSTRARYKERRFIFDSTLDRHTDYYEWLTDMCRRHGRR